MSAHTPGEWIVNGDQVEVQAEQNDGYRICDVFGPDYKANARLIAAAPEILEALKDLAGESTETFAHWPDLRKQVEAAIAKAEG